MMHSQGEVLPAPPTSRGIPPISKPNVNGRSTAYPRDLQLAKPFAQLYTASKFHLPVKEPQCVR